MTTSSVSQEKKLASTGSIVTPINIFLPSFPLGCTNLMKKALYELDFLQLIDQNRHLYYNEDFIKYSIIRYEKYWMPFLTENSSQIEDDLKFSPPLDIHWVWHVHMLGIYFTVGQKI